MTIYPRKTIAEINLQALAHNFYAIKSLLKPQTKFLASIKANAYGHGAVRLAQELERLGADMFGVSCLYEVIELRQAGIKLPILNMAPTFIDEALAVLQYDYAATVFSFDVAKAISDAAISCGKNAKIHIKVETGMCRVGADYKDVVDLVQKIQKLPNIIIEGIFTHFANADVPSSDTTLKQLQIFNQVLQDLEKAQIKISLRHAANSAATLLWQQSHFDMVRVGMSLYGYAPDYQLPLPVELRPIMSLKTYISHIKIVPANQGVSYGHTFFTKRESKIATLAIGYGDGLRRTPKNWEEVLCAKKRAPIIGRVCMDQTMIDITDIDDVKIGDEVVLIGAQGDEKITIWDVAKRADTSAYEVATSIAARVSRVYQFLPN